MADTDLPKTLPLLTLEEALPYLRRPYLPSQVYGKIQNTPQNPGLPCTIALYQVKDTLFDRFNLLCGRDWSRRTEVKREAKTEPRNGRRPRFYCEVDVTLTVFGKAESDIGEGNAATRAGAEMNALAQATKRAGTHFGPGQCLTACDEVLMFRDVDGEDKLRIPTQGDEPWMYPFFDLEGCGRRHVRSRYASWLTEDGEAIYGKALNHLLLAEILQSSPHEPLSVAIPVAIPVARTDSPVAAPPPVLVAAPAGLPPDGSEQNGHGRATPPPPRAREPKVAAPQASDYLPMGDHPAPIAAIRAAAGRGFGQDAARALCNLVRHEGQDEHVSRQQLGTVENWLTMLHSLSISEGALLSAAGHNAKRRTTQERRQALFSQWLARKAGGESKPPGDGDSEAPPREPSAEPTTQPAGSKKEDPAELAQAITELQNRIGEHDYDEQPVARLAALALGRSPNAKVSMGQLGTAMVRTLTDLLACAAAIGWDSERLDRELLEAHGSNQHTSAAGRFSAFANQLKDLAESRAGGDS